MKNRRIGQRTATVLGSMALLLASASGEAFSQDIRKSDSFSCTVLTRADYYENGTPHTSVVGRSYIGDKFIVRIAKGDFQWSFANDAFAFNSVQKFRDGLRIFLGVDISDSTRTITVLQILHQFAPSDDFYPFLLLQGIDNMTGACRVIN